MYEYAFELEMLMLKCVAWNCLHLMIGIHLCPWRMEFGLGNATYGTHMMVTSLKYD